MSNCENCDFCSLIDDRCLWTYSPLCNIPLSSIAPAVISANQTLAKITYPCNLCEDEGFDDVLETVLFKSYYSLLIYRAWVRIYGSGRPSKEGYVSKSGDEFSEYRVHSTRELDWKIQSINKDIEPMEEAFKKFFIEKHPKCQEQTNNCECPEQTPPSLYDTEAI